MRNSIWRRPAHVLNHFFGNPIHRGTRRLARLVNSILRHGNLELRRLPPLSSGPDNRTFPVEFADEDRHIVQYVLDHYLTMVGRERLFATVLSCRYVCQAGIPGDFVECGVWRGGNSLLAADVFRRLAPERAIHMFDTFAGMTKPSDRDVRIRDASPADATYRATFDEDHSEWCYSSCDEVRTNFARRGLLSDKVKFVKGDVLATLDDSANVPAQIAVLRLDTDWYESTKKELEVLWPRLVPGGVMLLDDYGHWGGVKQAVDEFMARRALNFLHFVDYAGRLVVKPASPEE